MAIFTYKRDWFDRKYGLVSKYHINVFITANTITFHVIET